MNHFSGLYMSDISTSTDQVLYSAKSEDGEEKSHNCKGRLVALRTKTELHAPVETTAAYIIEIPAKSASVVLQYVKPRLLHYSD